MLIGPPSPRVALPTVLPPHQTVDLLCKHRVQHAPQEVVGVAQEEEEDRDDEGDVGDDAPLGEEALGQTGAPHQNARAQGQPLVVGDHLWEQYS